MGVGAFCLRLAVCDSGGAVACVVAGMDGDAAALSYSNASVNAGAKAFALEGVKA